MPTRRGFLIQSGATGSLLASGISSRSLARQVAHERATKPLRVLILGGTGFLGPHFVRTCLDRGHRVTVFNRGQRNSDLPPEVERLIGDRSGNLQSLQNRDWDAVFDLPTFLPIWVRTLGKALAGRVGHYSFISSEGVYQFPGATDETSKVQEYTGDVDPFSEKPAPQGAALKVLCEREAERQFPGKTLIVRPGSIVGPRDNGGLFTYWPVRMQRGGEIVVPDDPFSPVQLIDVRDLVSWVVQMAERSETGVFNAVGPAMPMGWAEFLGAIRGMTPAPLTLVWASKSWLTDHRAGNLVFWGNEGNTPGLMRTQNDKARAKGMTIRPLSETAAHTLAWHNSLPSAQRSHALMAIQGKSASIEELMAREKDLLAAWRARSR